jgi:hypothetical protein
MCTEGHLYGLAAHPSGGGACHATSVNSPRCSIRKEPLWWSSQDALSSAPEPSEIGASWRRLRGRR